MATGLAPEGLHVQDYLHTGAQPVDINSMGEDEGNCCVALICAVSIGGPFNIRRRAATDMIYNQLTVLAEDESINSRYGATSNGAWVNTCRPFAEELYRIDSGEGEYTGEEWQAVRDVVTRGYSWRTWGMPWPRHLWVPVAPEYEQTARLARERADAGAQRH
ncbi:hypothetical protein Pmar_PMAR012474 [Perkinsus marinus ATCC 50983]|uniref:Uncharacterized protein n=1 Tax=Perkinsus marinus (strain ATCC 50983 / TXsc) TaxID=423536 RepID=C5K7F8_PERM5|nr:hypothetical protein Pmar_PMAR012474 [Perkinsus marinus ATCC 50983]EER19493.1 hypothetical protein Pmar_PMAR012474 [Perkinsus marinus ATCC 50983]|eukprot:XP_002787697.1 hypothetical protein Pmar_PMAR012474 [Perkinsus marinus ATCC 50983]